MTKADQINDDVKNDVPDKSVTDAETIADLLARVKKLEDYVFDLRVRTYGMASR